MVNIETKLLYNKLEFQWHQERLLILFGVLADSETEIKSTAVGENKLLLLLLNLILVQFSIFKIIDMLTAYL